MLTGIKSILPTLSAKLYMPENQLGTRVEENNSYAMLISNQDSETFREKRPTKAFGSWLYQDLKKEQTIGTSSRLMCLTIYP